MKKTIILILCILIFTNSIVLANYGGTVSTDLGTPQYLTLSLEDEDFVLKWINSENSMNMAGIEYQVDFRLGREKWLSEEGVLLTEKLVSEANSKSENRINLIKNGLINSIDLEENNYNFRIRYKYNGSYGEFSNVVRLGLLPYYENASDWAIEELDKATDLKLIPESIRQDMKKEITREEFAEVIIRLYELQVGQTVNHEVEGFKDCVNPEVLKAAKLGIVKGDENGKYLPTGYIKREELAVMLKRSLEVVYPTMDFKSEENPSLAEEEVSSWAFDSVQYMLNRGIIRADINGKINPQSHTTREEAVIYALRVYELFEHKKSNMA